MISRDPQPDPTHSGLDLVQQTYAARRPTDLVLESVVLELGVLEALRERVRVAVQRRQLPLQPLAAPLRLKPHLR